VANVAPAVTLASATGGVPANAVWGLPIALTAVVNDPGTADTFTYAWAVTKDGQPFDLTGVDTAAPDFTFTPNANGLYKVSLAVTDSGGDTTVAQTAITVSGAPLTVAITGAPKTSPEGTLIGLHSAVTDALASPTLTYLWAVKRNGAPHGATG